MPTVCHVLHTLNVGGGEALARDFALVHADEFRPVFALLDELGHIGAELRAAGFAVEVLNRHSGFDAGCVRRLARFLREQQVDLIHAHQYGPLLYSALARRLGCFAPVLFLEHGRDYPDFRRWKRVLANRLLLTRNDHFVAVGESVRHALEAYEGLPPDRIEVVYNGIDLDACDALRPQRDAVRRELGITDEDFVIIQVARLNRLKDHRTALRTLQTLLQTEGNAYLVLVGEGEEADTLVSLAGELGISGRVRFLGLRSDVPRLLHGADAFLLTSVSEGIPLTLIEAMATGLPCVATRVGGVGEVVLDGETGLLADAGDFGSLAAHLQRLMSEQGLAERLGTAGSMRARERFSARVMHDRYGQLYRLMTGTVRNTRTAG